jgi:UDP-glucose 4-epimerase
MAHKILITGSSGYIGSHLVKYFKNMGAQLYGIDLVFPPKKLQKYFSNHIVEDISNTQHVSEFLDKTKPDLVIHCAAKCLVAESVEKPDLYQEYNVDKPSTFLKLCIDHGILNFLFSSTAATYGNPIQATIVESHPQQPINPYGKTKLEFEKILLSKNELCTGIVRYFNAAGADPENEIGEQHEPETHLIPNVLKAIAENKSLSVFGNDYETKDGTCVRDYIHVMDLANAHWLLAQQMLNQKKGGIYNLGSANGFSILDVIQCAEKVTGKKTKIDYLPRRPGDPPTLVADSSHAKKNLNWNPQFNLEKIIQTAWSWHQSLD